MSADTDQSRLPGMGAPEPHLDTEPPNRKGNSADPERCEYFCRECGSRITRNSTNYTEYGHNTDCEYSMNVGSPQ